jgi:acyl-CoA synthetase (AMP-forming)/AMP-acid ligase II
MAHRSLAGFVLERAATHPQAIALVEGGREIGYAALARDIEAMAGRLHALGIAAGDTIALDLGQPLEDAYRHVCRLYALNYLGAAALPVAAGEPAARRERLLARFGARAPDWGQAPAQAPPPPRADGADRLTLYRFSTGSTGEPKAAIYTNAKWAAMQEASALAVDFDAADRLLPAIPLPHPVGLRNMLRVHAAGGALVNETLPQDLPALAHLVLRRGITRIAASPAQLRWLASRPLPAGFRMPPLRGVVAAGAPLSPQEQADVQRVLSSNLYIDYGAMDFSVIAVQKPGDAAALGARIVPGIEAEVVDGVGNPLPPGAEGLLRVRAPWAPQGQEGWYTPGDFARLGPGGTLRLLGRADDLINRGGIKIAPEAIEAVLREHPDVVDVAAAGVPDAIAGEVPVAFVVLRRLEALQDLDAWCRGRVQGIHFPAKFVALAAIPRSAEGKVLRAQLRTLVRGR